VAAPGTISPLLFCSGERSSVDSFGRKNDRLFRHERINCCNVFRAISTHCMMDSDDAMNKAVASALCFVFRRSRDRHRECHRHQRDEIHEPWRGGSRYRRVKTQSSRCEVVGIERS